MRPRIDEHLEGELVGVTEGGEAGGYDVLDAHDVRDQRVDDDATGLQ